MKRFLLIYISIPGLLFLNACKEKKQAATPPPVKVYVQEVKQDRVTGLDAYPGTVVPLQQIDLRSQVPGFITQIYVKDGQMVTKGQKLYEIDRSKYVANYKQAEASLQSAKASLERARMDLERYEMLGQREAIARQQLDYARTGHQTAIAQVAAAEASLSAAATDLRYSLIEAPFSGTVGISQVRVGAQVSAGQTLLNTISTDNPMAVDFVINEKEIPRFKKLMKTNQVKDTVFSILLADGSVYPHPGKIETLDRAVDRYTGTMAVRLDFPNPEHMLVAGMSVGVRVKNTDTGEQLVIPYKAVSEQMGEYYVYVLQADSVVQRTLKLGSRLQDMVVVRQGLSGGETIVVEGIQRLRQGARVDAKPLPATAQEKK